uniref:Uncharacterized protein n=1 Tax=Falco tinnunculus TaxID=100819 RepID=A0A8C4UE20_FALTI
MSHPEVLGVHMQLLTVQLRQLGVGQLNVVQVLHSFPEGREHFLAMGTDLGVAEDGGGAGEVPKGSKEPLGPGVDNQSGGSFIPSPLCRQFSVSPTRCGPLCREKTAQSTVQ